MTDVEPVTYATPAVRPATRLWVWALLVFTGLTMVMLGGCFLIGVMLIVTDGLLLSPFAPSTQPLTNAQVVLTLVLYVLAFLSFAAAALLLFLGIRGLLRTLGG